MDALTVRDLISAGEPLDPAEVLAGEGRLSNSVSWVVSLRPYPPAFPRLRGGELALVATEHMARLDPPTTLAGVVRQLASLDAAAVAVRGEVDAEAVQAAREVGLPLVRLEPDAPLHDIEQAIMRECAIYQARREMQPAEESEGSIDSLLAGRISHLTNLQALLHRRYGPVAHFAVAYFTPLPHTNREAEQKSPLQSVEERVSRITLPSGSAPIARRYADGLAVLLPQAWGDTLLASIAAGEAACGVGTERAITEVPASLAEAQLAASASALLHGGQPTHYANMGADRLLMLLYRDHADELKAFVNSTLGPLLRHDAHSATPLLPTLEAFLAHGARLRETAAEIYVHRNTLAYRLDRVSEILGVDLKDADERLAVELALRARPLVGLERQDRMP